MRIIVKKLTREFWDGFLSGWAAAFLIACLIVGLIP
jgi:hypothetical protein